MTSSIAVGKSLANDENHAADRRHRNRSNGRSVGTQAVHGGERRFRGLSHYSKNRIQGDPYAVGIRPERPKFNRSFGFAGMWRSPHTAIMHPNQRL